MNRAQKTLVLTCTLALAPLALLVGTPKAKAKALDSNSAQFSDGTKVEFLVNEDTNMWTLAQIKQADGRICYAVTGGGTGNGAGSSITCLPK